MWSRTCAEILVYVTYASKHPKNFTSCIIPFIHWFSRQFFLGSKISLKFITILRRYEFLINFNYFHQFLGFFTFTCYKRTIHISINKKNFMANFYRWGSTTSWQVPLQGGSLLFTTKFPDIPVTHSIDFWKDERLNQPWNHPLVLNTGPLHGKSSNLTTRPLLHKDISIVFW